jgi:hypothetical protein
MQGTGYGVQGTGFVDYCVESLVPFGSGPQ